MNISSLRTLYSVLFSQSSHLPSPLLFLHGYLLFDCVLSHNTSSMSVSLPVSLSLSPNWQRNNLYVPEVSSAEKYWHSLKKQFVFSNVSRAAKWPDLWPQWPNFTEMACQRLADLWGMGIFSMEIYQLPFLVGNAALPQRPVAIKKSKWDERPSISIPSGDTAIFLTCSSWAIKKKKKKTLNKQKKKYDRK